MKQKITSLDIEVAVSNYFKPLVNFCIPNVFNGLGLTYEVDLYVLMRSGYATEVEIKISKSDLKAEIKKKKYRVHLNPFIICNNFDNMRDYKGGIQFRKSYFAVPDHLVDFALGNIPITAGLFKVEKSQYGTLSATEVKKPVINKVDRLSQNKRIKLLELGCMRINNLKINNLDLQDRLREATNG